MANDGSLASLTEEWIAVQIRALAEFADDDVEVFTGSQSLTAEQLIEQFMSHRSLYATVWYTGDREIELEEGDLAYDATYAVLIVVQNARPGEARKGGADSKGTNYFRDVLRNALNSGTTSPGLSANGYAVDWMKWTGKVDVVQKKNAYIMRGIVVAGESPA